jgi:archaellum component FlaC
LTKTQEEIEEIKARVGPFKRDYTHLQNELNKVKEAYKRD